MLVTATVPRHGDEEEALMKIKRMQPTRKRARG